MPKRKKLILTVYRKLNEPGARIEDPVIMTLAPSVRVSVMMDWLEEQKEAGKYLLSSYDMVMAEELVTSTIPILINRKDY